MVAVNGAMKNPKKLILLMLICLGLVKVVTPANSINFKPTSHTEQEAANDVTDLLRSAYNALEAKKFDEALASCAKAIELNPKEYSAYALSGYAYQAQRKLKSASEAFAKAIELRPDIKELYLSKSQVDFFRNAHEEALSAAKQAVKLDPSYAKAHLMVGTLLRWDKQRQAEAITAYETALSINPQLWSAYDELGAIFESANEQKRAEDLLRKGMATDPNHMAGRFTLGRMLVKQGRLVEARELWDGRTSDEDHTFPQFIELLKRAENLKRATDALAQKPNDPDALIEMGMAVMEGDSWVVDRRQKRAIEYFRRALTLKPNYARAQYSIVKAYIEIAAIFSKENENVDRELNTLRALDTKLAAELDDYRKNYKAGLTGPPAPAKLDQ
jgi:tetratricopeptide (TPR) repeat protein